MLGLVGKRLSDEAISHAGSPNFNFGYIVIRLFCIN